MYFFELVTLNYKNFKTKDGSLISGLTTDFLLYEDEDLEEKLCEQKSFWIDEINGDQGLLKLLQNNVRGFFFLWTDFCSKSKIINLKLIKQPK